MDTKDLYERGLKLRQARCSARPMSTNACRRPGISARRCKTSSMPMSMAMSGRGTVLPNHVRSLVMLGITAASDRPAEFRVHAKGALANGCTKAQVQDVLLLVAMYCGVPAAIETTRIAAEVFGETSAADPAAKP